MMDDLQKNLEFNEAFVKVWLDRTVEKEWNNYKKFLHEKYCCNIPEALEEIIRPVFEYACFKGCAIGFNTGLNFGKEVKHES